MTTGGSGHARGRVSNFEWGGGREEFEFRDGDGDYSSFDLHLDFHFRLTLRPPPDAIPPAVRRLLRVEYYVCNIIGTETRTKNDAAGKLMTQPCAEVPHNESATLRK